MEKIKKFLRENKQILRYILFLFISTRFVLSLIGISSRELYEEKFPGKNIWKYSNNPILDVWGAWDTGFYLDIAKRGYTADRNFSFPVSTSPEPYGSKQTNYGFFPFYSIVISSLGRITKDYMLASLLISNIALITSAFLLYKLVGETAKKPFAVKCVKYLFLYPTAFLLSASLSESLTLCLILASVYFSRKRQFIVSGLIGGLSVLTRLTGILVVIPYIFEGFVKNKKNIIFWIGFLLIPACLSALFYYFWLTTGNPFIYSATKAEGWANYIQNPYGTLKILVSDINFSPTTAKFYGVILIFIIAQVSLLIYSYKKISAGFFLFWFLQIAIALSSGFTVATGIPRYSIIFFPQYIALSMLAKGKVADFSLTILLIITQIFFMAIWANGLVIS